MRVYKIDSKGAWEKYSDGSKVENDEIAFKVDITEFLKIKTTVPQLEEFIENLYILKELNPENPAFKKYEKQFNLCEFDGKLKEFPIYDFTKLDKIRKLVKKAVGEEMKKLRNKTLFIQNRIDWEERIYVNISFYRRMAIHVTDPSIQHLKEK